jgi:GNAT superfamily N-acetyltransferase
LTFRGDEPNVPIRMQSRGARMADVAVRMAETPEDFGAAQALCREWLDWHWRNYPDDWPRGADHPMNPERFEAIVEGLAALHERPRGGILLGCVDGRPVGCVMYRQAGGEADAAEFNRMFVSEAGRGHGVGRRMLERMLDQMSADGYRKAVFSSATFLTHARAMYDAAGFRRAAHPAGFPDEWRERIYFMERDLP